MKRWILGCISYALVFFGCAGRNGQDGSLVSLQLIDKNGFSEIISSKDRLKLYQDMDFTQPQPYQKVSKVFKVAGDPKNHCKVMSYHENGQIWQSLDLINGRANGKYLEWFSNGQLKIEGYVVEGTGDLTDEAKESWLFDQINRVWDERGTLIAAFSYKRGVLSENSYYYYPDGSIKRVVPFENDLIHGEIVEYGMSGEYLGKIPYTHGAPHGSAVFHGDSLSPPYEELYDSGLLMEGTYYDLKKNKLAQVQKGKGFKAIFERGHLKALYEVQNGVPDGQVKLYSPNGPVESTYQTRKGKKHGEEWVYYPSEDEKLSPKLFVQWYEDEIHGSVKTWYDNGVLESQKEYSHNKKNGLSVSWFKDGSLMFTEEYENDFLQKGSYRKWKDSKPVSSIEQGKGLATLYDGEGSLIKKVEYLKGAPLE